MAGSARPDGHANPDQLRGEIDRGRTGDKVAFPDPAAAPLGTDDEAAGTPVSPRAAATAERLETSRPHAAPVPVRVRGIGRAWIMVLFILIVAAAIIGAAFLP